MVVPLLIAAITGSAIGELVSGPLNSILSTVIPHENVTMRAALRMVAQGGLSVADFAQLEAVRRLQPEDNRVIVEYARQLQERYYTTSVVTLQKPYLKEAGNIFASLDDFDKAEFLGGLDDSLTSLKAVEAELVRLDRAERDAWMRAELAFNDVVTSLVTDRIKKIGVAA